MAMTSPIKTKSTPKHAAKTAQAWDGQRHKHWAWRIVDGEEQFVVVRETFTAIGLDQEPTEAFRQRLMHMLQVVTTADKTRLLSLDLHDLTETKAAWARIELLHAAASLPAPGWYYQLPAADR